MYTKNMLGRMKWAGKKFFCGVLAVGVLLTELQGMPGFTGKEAVIKPVSAASVPEETITSEVTGQDAKPITSESVGQDAQFVASGAARQDAQSVTSGAVGQDTLASTSGALRQNVQSATPGAVTISTTGDSISESGSLDASVSDTAQHTPPATQSDSPISSNAASRQEGIAETPVGVPESGQNASDNSGMVLTYYDEYGNSLNSMSLLEIWTYLANQNNIIKGDTTVSFDEADWAYQAAHETLTQKSGDSFGLAAAFAMFASDKGFSPLIICCKVPKKKNKFSKGAIVHAMVYIDGRYYDPAAHRSGLKKNIFAKKKYPLKMKVNRIFHFNEQTFQTGIYRFAKRTWYFKQNGRRATFSSPRVVRSGNNTYYINRKGYAVKKGWVIRGSKLYCFKGRYGAGLKNRTYKGIHFTQKGVAANNLDTSLKIKMMKILPRVTSRKKSKYAQLGDVYRYMSSHSHFHYEIRYPNLSDRAWAKKYANYMLTSRGGNCYGFAATFSAFADEIGFHPTIICGRIHGRRDHAADGFTRHAFVRINGRYFDPEASWAGWRRGIYSLSSYPMTVKSARSYKYQVKVSTSTGSSGNGGSKAAAKYHLVHENGEYSLIGPSGNKRVGAYFIKNKLYVFDDDGVMEEDLLSEYQDLIQEKSSFEDLKEVIGAPDGTENTGESCYAPGGEDCIEYYPNINVYTFRQSDGTKIIVSVASSFRKTISTKTGESLAAFRLSRAFKMAKKTGIVKKNGYIYGYKNGKKLKNKEQAFGGKTYYFSAKGRGFLSLRNKNGNKAAASIIDHVSYTSGMSKKKKLRAGYDYILSSCSYLGLASPDLSGNWVYDTAAQMAVDKRGKCYDYAALTYVYAKALGLKAKVVTGTCDRGTGSGTDHAWVLVGGQYVVDSVFADTADVSAEVFFYHTYEELKSSMGYVYTEG